MGERKLVLRGSEETNGYAFLVDKCEDAYYISLGSVFFIHCFWGLPPPPYAPNNLLDSLP